MNATANFIANPSPLVCDVDDWVGRLAPADVPIPERTAAALEEMRLLQDEMDARTIAEAIAFDPLMTIKLLRHVGQTAARRSTDVETARAALVLLGISPFFSVFGPQPTVERALAHLPAAQAGFDAVVQRARRAAQFALAFAVHLGDYDAPVIHEAALLHDFAEMLVWIYEPQRALAMQAQQRADPTLRSDALQRHWLGAAMIDVQHALMRHWHLPELLVRISDSRHADAPPVRCVALAVRLARHTAHNWHNPAIPDDVHEIAELLRLRADATLELLQVIDAD